MIVPIFFARSTSLSSSIVCHETEIETIKLIKSVLESYGFPVKADWGNHYGEV